MGDDHIRKTSVGSERPVRSVTGEMAGFVGQARDGENGKPYYARPCHSRNLAAGIRWFDSEAEAVAYLEDSLSA